MKLYIISFYLILVGTCRLVQSGSVCRINSVSPGKQVFISGYNNDIGQCKCQITLTAKNPNNKSDLININIAHFPVGCNYSLFYWLDGYNNKIESIYTNSTFSLNFNGTLYVGIENNLIGSGELCSIFSIVTVSQDRNVSARCDNLNITTPSTSISTNTSSPPESQTISIPITPSISQTVDTVSIGDITNTKSSSTTMTTIDQGMARAASDDNSLLPIILGCSVGGTVLIILLIVVVGCVLFRRQKTKISSGNSQQGEMVEIKNNINVSSDSIPNNNNQHGTKYMAEMEIIPNDLYQSSDSLFDDPDDSDQHEHVPEQLVHGTKDKSVMEIIPNDLYQSSDSLSDDMNDSDQHEHVPEQLVHGTKDNPVMEIIPNDLYQSSDSLADDLNRLGHNPEQYAPGLGQREHVPYTNPEYALVNKKPKKVPNRMKINQNPKKVQTDYENIEKEKKNFKLEIDRIVGPKGDDYTLVNKC